MIEPREFRVEQFTPQSPDPHLIRMLHREHADHVTFARHVGSKKLEQGANVPAIEIDRWFPQIAHRLERDSYFSVNGIYGHLRSRSKWCSKLFGGFRPKRRIQWLTACFVDLDLYHLKLDPETALKRLRAYECDGTIPPVSVWLFSGRGLWAFWLLRAMDGTGPLRARSKLIPLFETIQDTLADRLFEFAPDPAARDVARITRIPGSINSKSGVRVHYSVVSDPDSRLPITYTIDELASTLGIPSVPPVRATSKSRPSAAARSRGTLGTRWRAVRNNRRFLDLCRLRGSGGFRVGIRHRSARLLALFMRYWNASEAKIERALETFFTEFCATAGEGGNSDPIEDGEAMRIARATLKGPRRGLRVSVESIAEILDITPEEATLLARHSDEKPWPSAIRFRENPPARPPAPRDEIATLRREAIRKIAAAHPILPSPRRIQAALEKFSLSASKRTIERDLAWLGFANPRAKGSRIANSRKPRT